MKKKQLMKMNIQYFADGGEEGITSMTDLGEISSLDFVNRFEEGITELQKLLGVTNITELTSDLLIQMYDWTTDLKDGAVAEGTDIPLSKVTRKKGKSFSVTFNKWRRSVTAEAIARFGAQRAITQSDNKLLRQIQGGIKNQFVTYLSTAPTTPKNATPNLKAALAQSWGTLSAMPEFEGADFVSFVSPLDVANYLTDTELSANATSVFGMTLLQNFLGATNVIVLNAIPEGSVYSTAVDNINLAFLNMLNSDLGGVFADYTDETGYISVTHERQTKNATYDALYMNALVLFPEVPKGVVKATIGPKA